MYLLVNKSLQILIMTKVLIQILQGNQRIYDKKIYLVGFTQVGNKSILFLYKFRDSIHQ